MGRHGMAIEGHRNLHQLLRFWQMKPVFFRNYELTIDLLPDLWRKEQAGRAERICEEEAWSHVHSYQVLIFTL